MSMFKHVSDSNSVQADENLWKLHETDAGWLRDNRIPGRSDNIHCGVVLARISKKLLRQNYKKGTQRG
jgi:hypothetical protein